MSHQDAAEEADTTQAEMPSIVLQTDEAESPGLQPDFSAFADHPELSDLSDTASIGYQVDWTKVSDPGSPQALTFGDYAYSEFPASPSPVCPSFAPVSPYLGSSRPGSTYIGSPNIGSSRLGSPYIGSPYLAPYPSGESDASHSTTGSINGQMIDFTLDDQDDLPAARSDVEASSTAGPSDDTQSRSAVFKGSKVQRDIEEWFSVADNATRFKAEFERLRGWRWGDEYKKLSEGMSIPGTHSQLRTYVYANRTEFGIKPKVMTARGKQNQEKFESLISAGTSKQAIYDHFSSQKHSLAASSVRRMWTNSSPDFQMTYYKHWLIKTTPAYRKLAMLDTPVESEIAHSADVSAEDARAES